MEKSVIRYIAKRIVNLSWKVDPNSFCEGKIETAIIIYEDLLEDPAGVVAGLEETARDLGNDPDERTPELLSDLNEIIGWIKDDINEK